MTKSLNEDEDWKHLKTPKHHSSHFREILTYLAKYGEMCSPRGLKIVEVENFKYELPPYVRFCNFAARNLNLDYIKREFLWYLRGDRFDTSICDHAKMWKSLIQEDGGINSNYGQYIFNKECNQFDRVIEILKNDKDSRRASIVILQPHHVLNETSDQPCTYAIRFSIRNNKLGMTVHMRSQDAIFGMGNDAPCFSMIHEMVFVKLSAFYPELEYGNYTHFADSFHVYERHFDIVTDITGVDLTTEKKNGSFRKRIKTDRGYKKPCSYAPVLCPKISSAAEVDFLLAGNFSQVPDDFKFTKWLTTFSS